MIISSFLLVFRILRCQILFYRRTIHSGWFYSITVFTKPLPERPLLILLLLLLRFLRDFSLTGLEKLLHSLVHLLILLIAFQLIQVVIIVLYSKHLLLNNLDLILRCQFILRLIKWWYEILIDNRSQLNGLNPCDFLSIYIRISWHKIL